ncbi:MAG: YhcH/YjgK/YiaL family protein [Eubacteriales bacterium]|nr:YhcH/YjgK/YiaL family protein [Eubacteriales bacterium]
MDTAIRFLRESSLEELLPGRSEIDGDSVFVNRFAYAAIEESEAEFEAHRSYADIHLVLSGEEYIGVSDLEDMEITGEDKETDSVFCTGKVQNRFYMRPGKVLILFPEDAHKVKIKTDDSSQVDKIVAKVLL